LRAAAYAIRCVPIRPAVQDSRASKPRMSVLGRNFSFRCLTPSLRTPTERWLFDVLQRAVSPRRTEGEREERAIMDPVAITLLLLGVIAGVLIMQSRRPGK